VVSELHASYDRSGLSIFSFLRERGMVYLQDVADEAQGFALTAEERSGIEGIGVKLDSAHVETKKTKKTYTQYLTYSDPHTWTEKFWDEKRKYVERVGRTIWFNNDGTLRSYP
jgi:hypothetical protein